MAEHKILNVKKITEYVARLEVRLDHTIHVISHLLSRALEEF